MYIIYTERECSTNPYRAQVLITHISYAVSVSLFHIKASVVLYLRLHNYFITCGITFPTYLLCTGYYKNEQNAIQEPIAYIRVY